MNAYLLGALVFVIGVAVFVFQNNTDVIVHFINWTSPKISLALVVLISACAGALITFLVSSYRAFKTGQKLKTVLNQNRKYEKEIQALSKHKDINGKKEKEKVVAPEENPPQV